MFRYPTAMFTSARIVQFRRFAVIFGRLFRFSPHIRQIPQFAVTVARVDFVLRALLKHLFRLAEVFFRAPPELVAQAEMIVDEFTAAFQRVFVPVQRVFERVYVYLLAVVAFREHEFQVCVVRFLHEFAVQVLRLFKIFEHKAALRLLSFGGYFCRVRILGKRLFVPFAAETPIAFPQSAPHEVPVLSALFAAICEMYGDFNAMAQELAGVETLRSDFVSNVSHEFKTPLAAIEGYAALLQNKNLSSEKAQEYLGKIISNAHKLSVLTGNILHLSKLENQQNLLNTQQFGLAEQIRKTILMPESEWSAKNISFDLTLPDVQYCGDAGILFHVWYNLIGNAVKFSEQNGAVRIELRTAPDKISVMIEDHGCGIDEKTLPHIFEKFFQGDTSHSTEGNGLGLALVKRIVTLCRGEKLVRSEPGKGTAFTVILPVNKEYAL